MSHTASPSGSLPRLPALNARRLRASLGWLGYRPLIVVLVLGLALRIITTLLYFPTALQWIDAVRFSRLGSWHAFFGDYYMPAGYSAFLKVTHWISSNVAFTISVQHCMGLATGALIYYAVVRLGAPRWLGLIPAALAVLGGDQLYLEHLLMNDATFAFMIVLGLAVSAHALAPVPRLKWLAVAGATLAAAGLVRQTGLGLPIALAIAALSVRAPSLRVRGARVAIVLASAAVVVLLYIGVVRLAGGQYTGLTDMGGWNLYARVAPFANCHDFTPPAGTRRLCESTPPASRNGSFYYAWSPASRGWSQLGQPTPANESLPGKFADAAIEHQPLQYLEAVGHDVLRYADPNGGTEKPWSGSDNETVSFEQGLVDPATSAELVGVMGRYWSDLKPHLHHVQLLAWYESLTTPDGLLWVCLMLVSLIGALLAKGFARTGVLLFGLSALAIYVLPAMTLSWDWRYGIPAQVPLFAAASCAGWGLYVRYVGSRAHG